MWSGKNQRSWCDAEKTSHSWSLATPPNENFNHQEECVLTSELLSVNGLSTGAVALGEVTSLQHEVGDDTVEARALVSESVLASAELTEVLSGLGDNLVVELEDDLSGVLAVDGDCELCLSSTLGWDLRENRKEEETYENVGHGDDGFGERLDLSMTTDLEPIYRM